MLISIETHRTYDFPGGGGVWSHFIASANIKVLGDILHPWRIGLCLNSSKRIVYVKLFLKSYCLFQEKESTSGVRDVKNSFNFGFSLFNAGNDKFCLFFHKINVHLILL